MKKMQILSNKKAYICPIGSASRLTQGPPGFKWEGDSGNRRPRQLVPTKK